MFCLETPFLTGKVPALLVYLPLKVQEQGVSIIIHHLLGSKVCTTV